MESNNSINRRQLLKLGTAAAAGMIIARSASAEMPILSESDATAQALGYHADASAVDTAKWPKKAGPDGENQMCSTCSLFQDQGDGHGGCSIFPGKRVNANGWCNAWIGG